MHENSFGSTETKPPLIWTETFCGKGKTDRVNEGASYVSSRAQRLAMRHKHHAVALNAFSANCSFGTQNTSEAGLTQSSQQYSQQSSPSGC